jgi:AraC-like DNA-binding protein
MTNYFKYLPVSTEDESWGLHVLNAGFCRVAQNEEYPSPEHPSHHYFQWSNGRVQDEYQIIYISGGKGVFESLNCSTTDINEGTVLLLFPGEWHRYKPDKHTGWTEYWVGCKGDIVDNLLNQHFFSKENPVLEIGLHENMVQLFTEIIDRTREEKTGYQPLVAGIVLHLLGAIHAFTRQQHFEEENLTENAINKARLVIRTRIEQDFTMEQLAEELNVSYAWFRKAFKKYTGIAPHQYLIQLRIEKAKLFLTENKMPIKEIALKLNFESSFYFSRIFKDKTGVTPEQYRKNRKAN